MMLRRFLALYLVIAALIGCKAPGVEPQPHQQLDGQPDQVRITEEPPAMGQPTGVTPTQGATPLTATASPTVGQQPGRTQPVDKTSIPTVSAGSTVSPNGGAQTVTSSGEVSPHIVNFTASPERVNPGDAVTLSWEAVGSSAEMGECLSPDDGHLSHPCSPGAYLPVPLSGTRSVTIPKDARYHVEFHLLVKGSDESKPAAHESASAEITCPTTWFFGTALEFDSSCPEDKVVTSKAAWQTFERGSMMWIASTGAIHGFLDNGGYSAAQDSWDASMPEYDPNLVPPDGLYQPVRGFGLVWRDQQDAFGWATAPECAFNVTYQCSVYRYHDLSCYYQDPTGRILWIGFFGGWKLVRQ